MGFSFGTQGQDGIEFEVVGHEGEPRGGYWDDVALHTHVGVVAGGFRGEFDADFQAHELTEFQSELELLFQMVGGTAELGTSTRQVHLTLARVDAVSAAFVGIVQVSAVVADRPSHGNKLGFLLQFDSTQLRASLSELEKVVAEYPVRRN